MKARSSIHFFFHFFSKSSQLCLLWVLHHSIASDNASQSHPGHFTGSNRIFSRFYRIFRVFFSISIFFWVLWVSACSISIDPSFASLGLKSLSLVRNKVCKISAWNALKFSKRLCHYHFESCQEQVDCSEIILEVENKFFSKMAKWQVIDWIMFERAENSFHTRNLH